MKGLGARIGGKQCAIRVSELKGNDVQYRGEELRVQNLG